MVLDFLLWTSFSSLYLSLQVREKLQLLDEYGKSGISSTWRRSSIGECTDGWTLGNYLISRCFTSQCMLKGCVILSSRYFVNTTKELFIEIETETRNRSASKEPCENTFLVFANLDSNHLNKTGIRVFIGKIPQNKTLQPVGMFFETIDTISFSKDQGYDYVMVGFDGSSYCGTVRSFSIYHYICPGNTIELVDFVRQAAPIKSLSPKTLVGKCTSFAVERSSPLTMKCYFNGSFEVFGSCECHPGYTNVSRKCQVCEEWMFKNITGNEPCLPCGRNSESQQTTCICKPDHHRAKNLVADSTSDCYELPSRVSNIKFSSVTSSSVNVSWSDNVIKTRPYSYIIDCIGCYKRTIFPIETEQTYVILKDLDPTSLYYITVAVNNNITVLTGKWLSESGTFRTQNKDGSQSKGDINWGLIGGSVAGIVFVLIILGLAGRFLKFKRTNDGKKDHEDVSESDGNQKSYQRPESPIYAEVADPNYIPLIPGRYTCQTYQELNSTYKSLETKGCSNNPTPVRIDITNEGYTNLKEMNPYINAP